MKTTIRLLVALFSVLLLAVACQKKDNTKPEVITPAAPKILATFSTNNLTLKNGEMGVCTLTYNVEGVCYKFTVDDNDKRISDKCADIIRIDTITVSQHIRLTCYHFDGKDTVLIKREGMINVTYSKITPAISVTYDTVAQMVSWGTVNATSLSLNGVAIELSGNKHFVVDSLLHFIATSSDGTTTSQDVQVRMPAPKTVYQTVTKPKGWLFSKMERQFSGGSFEPVLYPAQAGMWIVYGTDGFCNEYDSLNILNGRVPWYLLNNNTKLQKGDVQVFNIISLTENIMILTIVEACDGCPQGSTYLARYTYVYKD